MENSKKQKLQDLQAMMRVMNMEEEVQEYGKQLGEIAVEAVSKGSMHKLALLTAILMVVERLSDKGKPDA